MEIPSSPDNTIRIDCDGRRIGFFDKDCRFVEVCFRDHRRGSLDTFLLCCGVAIAQDVRASNQQLTDWTGADEVFLAVVAREYLEWHGTTVTLGGYWRDFRHGWSLRTKRVRIRLNGASIPGEEQRTLATELFQREGGFFLGARSEEGGGKFRYRPIEFLGYDSEDVRTTYDRLRQFVKHLLETDHVESDVLEEIREYLKEEAVRELKKQLRSDDLDDYIGLKLEIGRWPKPGEDRQSREQYSASPLELGCSWFTFQEERLFPPRENYFLSSVSGAGKTTFLHHVRHEILKGREFLPIYFKAKDLPKNRPLEWSHIRLKLIEKFNGIASDNAIRASLDEAFRSCQLVFLIDALDNLGKLGMSCHELVTQFIGMAKDNAVVMTGRPSAAQWTMDHEGEHLTLLRLSPFDDPACRKFFSRHYKRAINLCGTDRNLLTTPMLGYMVRTLIQKRRDRRISSRWDLYYEFLKHILYKHPSNRQLKNHYQWASSIRKALDIISYQAVDREEPEWTVISAELVEKCLNDVGMPIDVISSAGLADLLEVDDDGGRPCLVFSHQSFQEFLAAEWASEDEERIDHVLAEYWNPKWREVIKFLAGYIGEAIVNRIYPGPGSDNPIHSLLFLAAECAGEIPGAVTSQQRLLRETRSLLHGNHGMFCTSALEAMISLKTTRAQNIVWRRIFAGNDAGVTYSTEAMGSLYSETRLTELLEALARVSATADPGVMGTRRMVLNCWSEHVSKDVIDDVIDQLGCSPPRDQHYLRYLVWPLRNRLCRPHLDKLCEMLTLERANLLYDLLEICADTADKLSSDFKWTVVRLLRRPHRIPMSGASLHAVGKLLSFFPDEHTDEVLTYYWAGDKAVRYVLSVASRWDFRLNAVQTQECLRRLSEGDSRERQLALRLLNECAAYLSAADVEMVLKNLEDRDTAVRAIRIAAGLPGCVRPESIRRILRFLTEAPGTIRVAALRAVGNFAEHLTQKDIGDVVWHLYLPYEDDDGVPWYIRGRRHELYVGAVIACSYIWRRLKKQDKWRLLESITCPYYYDRHMEVALNRISLELDEKQQAYVREEFIASLQAGVVIEPVFWALLDPQRFDKRVADLLQKLMKHDNGQVASSAYLQMRDAHDLGCTAVRGCIQ